MTSLVARLYAEDDNMGAGAAREAAEALTAAAKLVESLLAAGGGDPALLVGALQRLTEATAAAERLYERQSSAAMIREAYRREDYAALAWNDCAAARPGLRPVS